jgi:hypothetical protein
MGNVVGSWVDRHHCGDRAPFAAPKAVRAQQQTPAPRATAGRREAEVYPDLGAGLALAHAIAQMNHGDPNACHLGHVATAAFLANERP